MEEKFYYDDEGRLHREDGPALDFGDGIICWMHHGHTHRVGGPACVGYDGTEYYYQNSQLHREDGPAIIHRDGTVEYYLNDVELDEVTHRFLMNPLLK